MRWTAKALCILVTTMLGGSGSAMADETWKGTGFDNYVRDVMARHHAPGAAIAVVKDNDVVFAKGYGVRALGQPEFRHPDPREFAMQSPGNFLNL